MLKIFYHKSFAEEKIYTLDVIFSEVLGVDFQCIEHESKEYKICFENNHVILADTFFSEINTETYYYDNSALIPQDVKLFNSEVCVEKDLPVLFGDPTIEISDTHVYIGIDIVASSFFMLSRWEEIANKSRDKHDRFDEKESLSIRFDFHRRPIVNEYIELLWNVLVKLGYTERRKTKIFTTYPTHDIDDFERYDTMKKYVKAIVGDILLRKSLKAFIRSNKDCVNRNFRGKNDVYDTFDFLMNISETNNIKSNFYFIPGYLDEEDVRFNIDNKLVLEKINHIVKRGHNVGIHPSYSSYKNPETFSLELSRLKSIHFNVSEGRQHYLRFENPTTWQIWEDNGLKVDSSLGFYNEIGFRTGICQEYSVFNVVSRDKLGLKERPLILMDTALRSITSNKEEFISLSLGLINTVRKYNGDFVLLWHNSNLKRNEWLGWSKVYKEIIDKGSV